MLITSVIFLLQLSALACFDCQLSSYVWILRHALQILGRQ